MLIYLDYEKGYVLLHAVRGYQIRIYGLDGGFHFCRSCYLRDHGNHKLLVAFV